VECLAYYLPSFLCLRSRDSEGPESRGSRERESRVSDERDHRRGDDDRSANNGGAQGASTGGSRPSGEAPVAAERNGEYDGPAGMQPDGVIEVCILELVLISVFCNITKFNIFVWYIC